MRHWQGAWLVVLVGSSSVGCESFTPPPLAPHVDDTVPLPRGTAMLAVVYTEATSGRAIELRPSWQATADVRVGAGLTLASVPGDTGDNEWQFTGFRLRTIRGFAAWNPVGIRWGALSGGVGYGVASTGLAYVTFDGGLALGSATRPIAGGGALWGGASTPVRSGASWFDHHPRPEPDFPRTDFPLFAWNASTSPPQAPGARSHHLVVRRRAVRRRGVGRPAAAGRARPRPTPRRR